MIFPLSIVWALLLLWVIGGDRELVKARRLPGRWNVPLQQRLVRATDMIFGAVSVGLLVLIVTTPL